MEPSRAAYHRLADAALADLSLQLEMLPQGDVDLHAGNLLCRVDGVGEYVFSKQPPAMQIWASSPLTGPAKFRMDRKHGWVDLRHGEPFSAYIKHELERIHRMR